MSVRSPKPKDIKLLLAGCKARHPSSGVPKHELIWIPPRHRRPEQRIFKP